MKPEISAGAIVFHRAKDNQIQYLLLQHDATYWNFPKGHIEAGESVVQAARREIQEEAGLVDLKFSGGFKHQDRYVFQHNNQKIFKIVIFLLAEAKSKQVKISDEHIAFDWLSYEQAISKLKFKNLKALLTLAHKFLTSTNNVENI